MIRFFFKLILCVLLALAAGFAYLAVRSGDPVYTFYEWMSPARFQHYDRVIRAVAVEHHLDPMLVKAVVWRESRFDPRKHGSHGERGLMQVSEKAANEWARENKIGGFQVAQLFDPKTNLEAGSWYLHRAVEHWKHQADPLREFFGHGIVELAVDRPVNNDSNIFWFPHRALVLVIVIGYFSTS